VHLEGVVRGDRVVGALRRQLEGHGRQRARILVACGALQQVRRRHGLVLVEAQRREAVAGGPLAAPGEESGHDGRGARGRGVAAAGALAHVAGGGERWGAARSTHETAEDEEGESLERSRHRGWAARSGPRARRKLSERRRRAHGGGSLSARRASAPPARARAAQAQRLSRSARRAAAVSGASRRTHAGAAPPRPASAAVARPTAAAALHLRSHHDTLRQRVRMLMRPCPGGAAAERRLSAAL
jgi:hypothetical protein